MRDLDALVALIEARTRTPFAWGDDRQDCVSFAAACVLVQTGVDLIARVGHSWSTARGAARVLKRVGGVVGAADLALERIAIGRAMRGDVGLVTIDGLRSLVIFEGPTVVGPGVHGLVRLQRDAVTTAWSAERVKP